MKKTMVVSFPVVVVLALCSAARARADQIECGSRAPRVLAVTAPGQHVAQVDFSASGGNLDPVPLETDQNLPRMLSYHFFAEVPPGPHTVEVLYAGCCSANPDARSGVVQSPLLTLQYR